jgi:hypothetical protein
VDRCRFQANTFDINNVNIHNECWVAQSSTWIDSKTRFSQQTSSLLNGSYTLPNILLTRLNNCLSIGWGVTKLSLTSNPVISLFNWNHIKTGYTLGPPFPSSEDYDDQIHHRKEGAILTIPRDGGALPGHLDSLRLLQQSITVIYWRLCLVPGRRVTGLTLSRMQEARTFEKCLHYKSNYKSR